MAAAMLIGTVLLSWACAEAVPEELQLLEQEHPDINELRTLDAYLKSEVEALHWPAFVVRKEAGAVTENGRVHAFCILTVETLDHLGLGNLVLKGAIIFGSALRYEARLERCCVTIRTGRNLARVFIPIETATQIGQELELSTCTSLEARCALVNNCDWQELDQLVENEALTHSETAAPPLVGETESARILLEEFVLKDGRCLHAAASKETDTAYAITDAAGRFVRLRKADISAVRWPQKTLGRFVLAEGSDTPKLNSAPPKAKSKRYPEQTGAKRRYGRR